MIRILVADDHTIVREGLKQLLSECPRLEVAGEAGSGQEVLSRLRQGRYDVLLLDISLEDRSGLDVLKQVQAEWPGLPVLMLTMHREEEYAVRALRAGAAGYVRKDAEPETLLAAVRTVARGKTYIDPTIGRQMLDAAVSGEMLTPRETEVLRHVALGRSNKDIAAALAVGEETVKTHVGNVLSKLHVENRAQAIVQALKRGLVSLDELQ